MITIRPYNSTDKKAVLSLLEQNTPKYFSPEERKELDFYLDNEIEFYFVAEAKNKIIGSGGINLKGTKTTGYLSWDFVHPEMQGMGIGTLLVNHRIQHLTSMIEISTILVRTSQLVFPFYEKCGFKLVKRKADYWAKGYDLYEMTYKP